MNTRSIALAGSTRSIRFRRMISPLLSASLAVAVGSACSGNTPTNEPTEVTESAIRNGTIAYPFDANSPTAEAQSVIDLGCTGTLVDQNWVLTAAHCNVAVGRKVTARRPAGNITRTVDGVYTHPATDAALLHLDRAITDVTPATLYTGTMDSLINASMTCYGYGAKTATAPCTTDANCGGNSCWQGHCLTPSAELRYGTNFVVASVDTYGFYYPGNAQTQMLLPGDSGGPCFLGGQQVGINTNDWLTAPSTGNNRDTGIPAILPWIQQTINGVGFVPGYPRIGELRNNYDGTASFFVKEGQAFSDWVTEHDNVISGALSGTRIAVLTADHHCLVRDGNLTEGYWVDEWTAGGINQCVIAGNRIGILRNDGHFLVKEGDLYADWVDELSTRV